MSSSKHDAPASGRVKIYQISYIPAEYRETPNVNDTSLAYFLTWTTYGTWLPGDERGWVKWHGGFQQPSEPLRKYSTAKMSEAAITLDQQQRELVDATIRRHCEIRQWFLHALNVRTNHVHVVVTAVGYSPEMVVEQFKAWCTRYLKAPLVNHHAHLAKIRQHWWTEGFSRRLIFREADLAATIEYVLDAQDRPRS